MKKTVTFRCDACKRYSDVEARPGDLVCLHCAHPIGKMDALDVIFDHCPVCQCPQFYLSKDFNQFLGCLTVLIAIILVPWTYGLSLPILALIDWVLYQRVPTSVNCYKCRTEFKGFAPPDRFKSFSHHTGLQYDPYRK